jgi:predicted metal-binding membrane protein
MIVTYAEIADTAAAKGMPVVSPFIITLGYLAVWLGFSATAATAQLALVSVTSAGADSIAGVPVLTGILCLGAGLYQFSTLKHACLSRCQRPFTVLFARWQTRATGVFRLGVRQGLDCLGCCWALMALMLAAGTMNVLWMAALGAVMTIEKLSRTATFSYAIGTVLIGAGLASLWFTFS